MPPTTPLREVTRLFANSTNDLFFVASAGDRLEGLVTLTDILRVQGNGAAPETPVAEFMVKNPAAIAATDTALVAASAFREHGVKTLPVLADPATRRIGRPRPRPQTHRPPPARHARAARELTSTSSATPP